MLVHLVLHIDILSLSTVLKVKPSQDKKKFIVPFVKHKIKLHLVSKSEEEAGRGRKHEDLIEQARCTLLTKVDSCH